MRGKEGLRWWFGLAVVGISAGKAPDPCQILLEPGNFSTVFMARERRFPVRLAKVFSTARKLLLAERVEVAFSEERRIFLNPQKLDLSLSSHGSDDWADRVCCKSDQFGYLHP